VVYGLDGDFSEERLTERYNADLANDLGNFTSRVLTMVHRYLRGELKEPPTVGDQEEDRVLAAAFDGLAERVGALVDQLAMNRALEAVWQALDAANKYIAATAPFTLAKDPGQLPRVAQILANSMEGLRVITDLLEPFMPVTAERLSAMLHVDCAIAGKPWGAGFTAGHKVKAPAALFPRIEKPKD
jgi:methionyl-tRNA synthetase